jgi:hypothetical protein
LTESEQKEGMSSERGITDIVKDLESPFLDEEVLAVEPHHEFDSRLARLTYQSPLIPWP